MADPHRARRRARVPCAGVRVGLPAPREVPADPGPRDLRRALRALSPLGGRRRGARPAHRRRRQRFKRRADHDRAVARRIAADPVPADPAVGLPARRLRRTAAGGAGARALAARQRGAHQRAGLDRRLVPRRRRPSRRAAAGDHAPARPAKPPPDPRPRAAGQAHAARRGPLQAASGVERLLCRGAATRRRRRRRPDRAGVPRGGRDRGRDAPRARRSRSWRPASKPTSTCGR